MYDDYDARGLKWLSQRQDKQREETNRFYEDRVAFPRRLFDEEEGGGGGGSSSGGGSGERRTNTHGERRRRAAIITRLGLSLGEKRVLHEVLVELQEGLARLKANGKQVQ